MFKKILLIAIVAAAFSTSCKSAQQKETAAKQNVANAKQNLEDTEAANANDWMQFKKDAQKKITDNEKRIADLKVQMNKPGNTFDGIYRNRIEKLEAKNTELKSRLNNYDGNQTGWKTFKNDFNRDMNEVGDNIKDLFK